MLRVLRLALLALVLSTGARAAAQPIGGAPSPQDRIVAQALFEDGRRLMRAGRAREACVKFEESNRLDPAIGTQFNLADCYASTGLTTRAWILFVDVAAAARTLGQSEREKAARERASELEPLLTRLRIEVEESAPGLEVKRNGVVVPRPQWGTAVPVEPGIYRIEARAPGRRVFRREVRVDKPGTIRAIAVPRLAAATPSPDREDGPDVRRAAAVAMAALAVGALASGTTAGVVAIERKNTADDECPQEGYCSARGIELRDEAREAAAVSTVSFVVAGGAAIGSLLLWLTAPDEPDDAGWTLAPSLHPEAAGAWLGGRF